jgi:hypothetical protein
MRRTIGKIPAQRLMPVSLDATLPGWERPRVRINRVQSAMHDRVNHKRRGSDTHHHLCDRYLLPELPSGLPL